MEERHSWTITGIAIIRNVMIMHDTVTCLKFSFQHACCRHNNKAGKGVVRIYTDLL